MKKYITIAALLAAGTAFSNAGVSDWTNWVAIDALSSGSGTIYTGGDSQNLGINWSGETDLAIQFSIDVDSLVDETDSPGAGQLWKEFFAFDSAETVWQAQVGGYKASDRTVSVWSSVAGATLPDQISFADGITVLFEYDSAAKIASFSINGTEIVSDSLVINDWVRLAFGNDFNNARPLSGTFNYIGATAAYSVTSIPEPSAFGLLAGVGALALVAARRRRSK